MATYGDFLNWIKKHRPEDLEDNIENTFWSERFEDTKYFSIQGLAGLMKYTSLEDQRLVPDDIRKRVRRHNYELKCIYRNTFMPSLKDNRLITNEIIRYLRDGTCKWQDLPQEFIDDLKNGGAKWLDTSDVDKEYVRAGLQKIGRWEQVQVPA